MRSFILGLLCLLSVSSFAQPQTSITRQFTHLDVVYEQVIVVEGDVVVKMVHLVKHMDPLTRTLKVVEESYGIPNDEIEVSQGKDGTYWFNQEYYLSPDSELVLHHNDEKLEFMEEFEWHFVLEYDQPVTTAVSDF